MTPMAGKRHLASLDGLRGISILLVLIGHGGRTVLPLRVQWWLAPLANVGVSIFFVLSGFLITTLLLEERRRTGAISLRRFYLRRALRIVPASYVYVGVVASLAAGGAIALRPHDLACALLYVMDYHHDRSWYLGHYWSLSVEEQFYLAWPPALQALGARAAVVVAVALLAIAELVPAIAMRVFPGWNPALRLPNGAAPITIGCLAALALPWIEPTREPTREPAREPTRIWTSRWWLFAFVVAAAVQVHFQAQIRVVHGLKLAVELLAGAVVVRSVLVTEDRTARVLSWPALTTLGTLSYSLYIWQQLFLGGERWWRALVFPFDLVATLAAATLSYLYVERPFLRLKRRFAT